jgi:hypothetical protein
MDKIFRYVSQIEASNTLRTEKKLPYGQLIKKLIPYLVRAIGLMFLVIF